MYGLRVSFSVMQVQLLFVVEGSIVAMAAIVTVVAGIATVTTQKVHAMFSGGEPKDKGLQAMLKDWRGELKKDRSGLTKLKRAELDLLALEPVIEPKLLRAKHRKVGTIQSVYREPLGYWVRQEFPRAKRPYAMTYLTTATHEYVYTLRGTETHVTLDGEPYGVIEQGRLTLAGRAEATARLVPQRDGRTVHVDRGEATLGILLKPGVRAQLVPRAFEFVDVNTDEERQVLELMTYHYLLTENLPA